MIKFFRNIRKKLLAEGKTTNYLKYAIGEIVLVVIGIFIALQVNDWNEDNKLIKEEGNTLEKLHQESEDIVSYLNTMYKTYEAYINGIEKPQKHYMIKI